MVMNHVSDVGAKFRPYQERIGRREKRRIQQREIDMDFRAETPSLSGTYAGDAEDLRAFRGHASLTRGYFFAGERKRTRTAHIIRSSRTELQISLRFAR